MAKLQFDPYTRGNQVVVDGLIFTVSFGLAYAIRFEGVPQWQYTKQFLLWLPYLVATRLVVNWRLGIYKFIWRYVSLSDAFAISQSLSAVTAFLVLLRLFYPGWAILAPRLRISLSVIAMEFSFSLVGCLGARGLRRILYERGNALSLLPEQRCKRMILYGAGRAGIMLLKELKDHSAVEVVGFVDDDPKKIGTVISGVTVLGGGEALRQIVRRAQVDEVVISIATAGRRAIARVVAQCEDIPVSAKVIPSLREIIAGRVSISQLREVRVEELLGRDSVEVTEFDDSVRQVYRGKRILVTGAGGSIGSELVRQLLLLEPDSIAALDKDENSIYELEQELAFEFPDARIDCQIGDLRQRERLIPLFAEFRPQVVFHAAAHKHVPLMEKQPCEAVLNNISGTNTLLDACRENGVERFVYISTDKAVNPASVMGATKRVGEMLVQAFASGGFLRSACVRFGNVMGSRGSVIHLFRRQIAEGGPVTVTDPEVVRFFMTIPEAVQLVLCAGTLGQHGEVFVLDMGNPRKILDLAHEMVRLSGLELVKDIEVSITGLRPGEKLVEELVGPAEQLCATRFEKLSMIIPQSVDSRVLLENVTSLVRTAQENNRDRVHELLSSMGLAFRPRAEKTGEAFPVDGS